MAQDQKVGNRVIPNLMGNELGNSVCLFRNGVATRTLNQAVRRNLKRFPSDFMFELSREEIQRISQTVTSSEIKFSKRVHAFTEQGVAMLSTVLNSEP